MLAQHQPDQNRRDENTKHVGSRGRADSRRHIAPCDRRKRNGRLHRGRQTAQEQDTQPELGQQQPRHQRMRRQPQQGKDNKGAAHDQQVQPPGHHAIHHCFTRKPRPLQKEHERDQPHRQPVKDRHRRSVTRQHRRQKNGAEQADQKRILFQETHHFCSHSFPRVACCFHLRHPCHEMKHAPLFSRLFLGVVSVCAATTGQIAHAAPPHECITLTHGATARHPTGRDL